MTTFSKKAALHYGWSIFKKRPWFFVLVTAIFLGISVLAESLTKIDFVEDNVILAVLFFVLTTVLTWWVYLGYLRITLQAPNTETLSYKMLFAETGHTLGNYIVAVVLFGIIVLAGLILLIIPGIILAIMLYFFVYVLLDKNMRPIDTLKESKRLTKGHRWNLFWFAIIVALLNILGAVVVFVGLLVTLPVTLLATVYVYRELERHLGLEPAHSVSPTVPEPHLAPMAQ